MISIAKQYIFDSDFPSPCFDVPKTWNLTSLLTYFGPLLFPEHRPPTITRQSPLFCTISSSCFHVCPVLLISFSSSRRQVFRGLPLFRWPWEFQFRAWRPMLQHGFQSVWPSHLHLLRRMSSTTGVCWALGHRLSLLMVPGQWILSILRKHWFIKVWIFFMDALGFRHVSTSYNNADSTFELNKRTFVEVPISLEFHTFFSML